MAQPVVQPLPNAAAKDVIDWIEEQDFYNDNQQPNYAVGLTADGNMIISKVGGVTEKTKGMIAMQKAISETDWFSDHAPKIYLAQKYGGDGNSNHGEMCVLAAADSLEEQLTYILCTGDNCPACYATLQSAGTISGNASATGSQAGWVHPRGTMALGNQMTSSWTNQITELKAYNRLSAAAKKTFSHVHTQKVSFTPEGAYQLLL